MGYLKHISLGWLAEYLIWATLYVDWDFNTSRWPVCDFPSYQQGESWVLVVWALTFNITLTVSAPWHFPAPRWLTEPRWWQQCLWFSRILLKMPPSYISHPVYTRQAVVARWAATAWFSGLICTWQLHAASPLRSVTYISKHAGANQIATRLLRHSSGPACCCSQSASRLLYIGLLPAVAPTELMSAPEKPGLICSASVFGKMSLFS